MPLNGRNAGQLSLLLPGVVSPNPSTFTGVRNTGAGGRPYVNGNREQTNNYTIDGVDMNESIDNLVAYQPSPDALAQISVETNNYAADTGNVAGAVISNVIKSGSNRFRETHSMHRNSSMDANSWSNNRSHAAKPERRQDIYGGTLGGPLMKNKLFFFRELPGTKFNAPGSEAISVAPDSWRHGDLSSITTAQGPGDRHRVRRQSDTAGRINGIANGIVNNLALYPLPNRSVTGVTGKLRRRDVDNDSRQPGRRSRRLERVAERQDLRTRLDRRIRVEEGNKRAIPLLLGNLTTLRSGTLPATGITCSTSRSSTVLVG